MLHWAGAVHEGAGLPVRVLTRALTPLAEEVHRPDRHLAVASGPRLLEARHPRGLGREQEDQLLVKPPLQLGHVDVRVVVAKGPLHLLGEEEKRPEHEDLDEGEAKRHRGPVRPSQHRQGREHPVHQEQPDSGLGVVDGDRCAVQLARAFEVHHGVRQLSKHEREHRGGHAQQPVVGGLGNQGQPPSAHQDRPPLRPLHGELGHLVKVVPPDHLHLLQEPVRIVRVRQLDEAHRVQQAGQGNDGLLELRGLAGVRLGHAGVQQHSAGGIQEVPRHLHHEPAALPPATVGLGESENCE
mmetsp:Transcript_12648/g.39043  ORF Transcript_12648/g.39043 Transcript_12648/m.39043 type:complete len:297 (-) Transcript_12648:236-1126(-)